MQVSSSLKSGALHFVGFLLLGTSIQQSQAWPSDYYTVPTFTFEDLQSGVSDAALKDVLVSTGLIAVRVPVDNGVNLKGLCQCDIGPHIPGGDHVLISAEVDRATIATATKGTQNPLALPRDEIVQSCSSGGDDSNSDVYESLEYARAAVSRAASGAFLPALDRLVKRATSDEDDRTILPSKGDDGAGYETVTDIVEDATNLEHFHVYSKKMDEREKDSRTTALEWHTDAGLFLAFLPGQLCHDSSIEDESFRVRVPSSTSDSTITEKVAMFPQANNGEAVVAIMLGTGAQHWLQIPEENTDFKLQATQHAVQMSGGNRRVWYGKMYLVPANAIVQTSPTQVTFLEMRNSVAARSTNDVSSTSPDISVGCGNSPYGAVSPSLVDTSRKHFSVTSRRKLQEDEHGLPTDCRNKVDGEDFYCWTICAATSSIGDTVKLSGQEHVDQGDSLYCLNKDVLAQSGDTQQAIDACTDDKGISGGVLDTSCINVWQKTVEGAFTYVKNVKEADKSSTSEVISGDGSGVDVNSTFDSTSGTGDAKKDDKHTSSDDGHNHLHDRSHSDHNVPSILLIPVLQFTVMLLSSFIL